MNNDSGGRLTCGELVDRIEMYGTMVADIANKLCDYEDIGTVEEFRQIKQAQEDGRIVVLPCKIGTPVYYVGLMPCRKCPHSLNAAFHPEFTDEGGEEMALDCDEECPSAVRETTFTLSCLEYMGSEYYATEAEAEAVLEKEGQDGK